MNAERTPTGRRYTVNEAAEILGISAEAVRARMNRGTLLKEKDEDGTVYVRMNAEHTHMNGEDTDDHTVNDRPVSESMAFQLMQDQSNYLRGVLETRDRELSEMRRLLAGALERIPALEPAPEATGAPVSPSENSSNGGEHQEQERRSSWWRRLLEG